MLCDASTWLKRPLPHRWVMSLAICSSARVCASADVFRAFALGDGRDENVERDVARYRGLSDEFTHVLVVQRFVTSARVVVGLVESTVVVDEGATA